MELIEEVNAMGHVKVALVGATDHDNFGDSLMFAFYIRLLNNLGLSPLVVGATNIFMERLYDEGLNAAPVALNELSKEIDAFVYIGGGYFGQPDITWPLWQYRWVKKDYYYGIFRFARDNSIPIHVQGAELGPLTGGMVKNRVRQILEYADTVVLRNRSSVDFAKDICGVRAAQYRPDVVYGCSEWYMDQSSAASNPRDPSDSLVVGVHATKKILGDNFLARRLRSQILSVLRASDRVYSVEIIFDQSTYWAELGPLARDFQTELSSLCRRVDIFEYQGITSTLKKIRNADIFITTKLHCGVVAIGMNKRVVCVSNMPKIRRFYSEFGLSRQFINYYCPSSSQFSRAFLDAFSGEYKGVTDKSLAENSLGYLNSLESIVTGLSRA